MSETDTKIDVPGPWSRKRLVLFLPLAIFLALALLFFSQLGVGDPSKLPSVLINKPVPDFALPPLEGFPGDGLRDENWPRSMRKHYGVESFANLQNTWLAWVRQGSPTLTPQAPSPSLPTPQTPAGSANATLVAVSGSHPSAARPGVAGASGRDPAKRQFRGIP